MRHSSRFNDVCLAVALMLAIALCGTAYAAAPAIIEADVEAFDKARQEADAVVIDVRSPEEYAAGHVPGALNIPVTGKGAEDFDARVAEAAKGKKPLVYCRSGIRSATAAKKMAAMGIGPIIEFPGGWVAWEKAKKPAEKGTPKAK